MSGKLMVKQVILALTHKYTFSLNKSVYLPTYFLATAFLLLLFFDFCFRFIFVCLQFVGIYLTWDEFEYLDNFLFRHFSTKLFAVIQCWLQQFAQYLHKSRTYIIESRQMPVAPSYHHHHHHLRTQHIICQ